MRELTRFDPVLDSQKVFRKILHCMSCPGTIAPLSTAGLFPPSSAAAAVALTLLDGEVSYAVPPGQDWGLIVRAAALVGCRAVPPEEADFVFLPGEVCWPGLGQIRRGSLLYPEKGATLVLSVGSLFLGPKEGEIELTLQGPGVKGRAVLGVTGLAESNLHGLKELNGEYPFGVDAILVSSDGRIACLPRSVSLSWKRLSEENEARGAEQFGLCAD